MWWKVEMYNIEKDRKMSKTEDIIIFQNCKVPAIEINWRDIKKNCIMSFIINLMTLDTQLFLI